jgi:O-antigen/teichoic acid export membrane protein
MMLYTRIDAIMLERMLIDGKIQSGIYAQAYRLLDAANIFGLLIAGLLLPIFSRLLKEKESIVPLLTNAGLILIGIALTFSIATSFYAYPIIELIYKNNVEASALLFPWIIFSFIPICGAYLFGTLLTANGSLKLLNKMALTAIIVNTLLNLILIPDFKAEGAAIATLITQVFASLFQAFLVLWVFKLKLNLSAIGKLTLQIGLLMGVVYVLKRMPLINDLTAFFLVAIVGIGGLFLFRIISISQVKELVIKEPDKIMR